MIKRDTHVLLHDPATAGPRLVGGIGEVLRMPVGGRLLRDNAGKINLFPPPFLGGWCDDGGAARRLRLGFCCCTSPGSVGTGEGRGLIRCGIQVGGRGRYGRRRRGRILYDEEFTQPAVAVDLLDLAVVDRVLLHPLALAWWDGRGGHGAEIGVVSTGERCVRVLREHWRRELHRSLHRLCRCGRRGGSEEREEGGRVYLSDRP